jgi:hypothetical protein
LPQTGIDLKMGGVVRESPHILEEDSRDEALGRGEQYLFMPIF